MLLLIQLTLDLVIGSNQVNQPCCWCLKLVSGFFSFDVWLRMENEEKHFLCKLLVCLLSKFGMLVLTENNVPSVFWKGSWYCQHKDDIVSYIEFGDAARNTCMGWNSSCLGILRVKNLLYGGFGEHWGNNQMFVIVGRNVNKCGQPFLCLQSLKRQDSL